MALRIVENKIAGVQTMPDAEVLPGNDDSPISLAVPNQGLKALWSAFLMLLTAFAVPSIVVLPWYRIQRAVHDKQEGREMLILRQGRDEAEFSTPPRLESPKHGGAWTTDFAAMFGSSRGSLASLRYSIGRSSPIVTPKRLDAPSMSHDLGLDDDRPLVPTHQTMVTTTTLPRYLSDGVARVIASFGCARLFTTFVFILRKCIYSMYVSLSYWSLVPTHDTMITNATLPRYLSDGVAFVVASVGCASVYIVSN